MSTDRVYLAPAGYGAQPGKPLVPPANPRTKIDPRLLALRAARGEVVANPLEDDGPIEPTRSRAAIALSESMEEVGTLPSNRPAITAVLTCADDATTSAKDLAEACSLDAGMTASLLRTANSAFYGLSGRVTTVQFAISVIGFTSVRALAAVSVVDDDTVPSEWWIASSLHAVAAGHVAPRVGALSPDAFCAGLLCDIGRPMLRKVHPSDYDALCTRAIHPDDLPKLEREWAERSHTDVAAEMFSQWNFPELLVDAIAQHHDPIKAVQPEPLRLAVRIGQEISSRISGARPRENIERITKGALSEPEVAAMTRKIKEEAAGIRMALGL